MDDELEMFVEFSGTGELQFTLNRHVESPERTFESAESAAHHPLASRLLEIEGVAQVRLSESTVAIRCSDLEELEAVAARVELVLRHLFG